MAGPYAMLSKYRLLARLGSGGMAEVYLVLAEGPGGFSKLQVLKLMRSDLTDQERPEFLQMFQDEARLAARLNHPNIVQSHEVGLEDGQPFIVMEFLEGQSLHRVQQRSRHLDGSFTLEMELFVLCQVLEGLDYAHRLTDYDGTQLNIIHRDVSPQNVFITYAGQSKLLDFGVAKTLESSKTRAGVVKGKVAYMPPEQVKSGPIDKRADLFSVGVLLWEAIAGQPMHAELSVFEALNRLMRGELPKLRDAAPEVPRELERIVERALALDPEQRYPDAETFRHDLHAYIDATSKVRPREIGATVAKLFARERDEISQVIRSATSGQSDREGKGQDFPMTRLVPFAPRASELSGPATLVATPVPPDSRRSLVQRVQASGAMHKGGLHKGWLGVLSVAVVLVASALVALMSKSSGARVLQQGNATGAELSSAEASGEREQTVQVDIQAEPKHAAIFLDGRVLGVNPYRGREPRDNREHALAITAPGFEPFHQVVRFHEDVSLRPRLEPATPLAPEAAPPRAKTKVEARAGARERNDETARAGTRERSDEVASGARREASRSAANRARTPHQTTELGAEPYRDLPPPQRMKRAAPELDRSDPWARESQR